MSADPTNDLLLITSASGKQASFLLPRLSQKWKHLRLICVSESSQKRLQDSYPHADVRRIDLLDRSALFSAFDGVTACVHIGPSFHPHETQVGFNVIDAAVAASGPRSDGRASGGQTGEAGSSSIGGKGTFRHFVYSSVLNTQLRKLLNHDCKRYVEEYLLESGLDYTILQPTHFMQTFPIAMLAGQEAPSYPLGWDPAVPFSYLDLSDLAEATTRVLEERERHYLAQYPLCSTGPMTYVEMAQVCGEVVGKEIKVEKAPFEQGVDMVIKILFDDAEVHVGTRDVAERLLLYYNRHGLVGNPIVLEWLLCRKPTTMKQWAERTLTQAGK